MIVYVNGSFITSKPSPNDIDMHTLTDFCAERQIKACLNYAPPITSQQEYDGYKVGLARLNAVCVDRERSV